MKRKLLIIALAMLALYTAKAQVGISTTTFLPPSNTMLEVKSGSDAAPMGFIMPRFNSTQETNIGLAALTTINHDGLMFYSTIKKKFVFYDGSTLLHVNPWNVNDNLSRLIYNPGVSFRVGIGQINPATELDVNGTITSTGLQINGSITATGLQVNNTDAAKIPAGTDAQRPASPSVGMIRFNTDLKSLEFYDGLAWVSVLPPGTIVAFGGTAVPAGWLLCDGAPVSQTTYSKLFTAIGIAWGDPIGLSNFNVPDLRGKFLRGVDGVAGPGGFDPDDAARTAIMPGGNTGNAVGSYQVDATSLPNTAFGTSNPGDHAHFIAQDVNSNLGALSNVSPNQYLARVWTGLDSYRLQGGDDYPNIGRTGDTGSHTHTLTGGDNETRPKNVYVNFIIKY